MISDEIIKVLDNISEKSGIVIDWSDKNILPYLSELSDKIVNYELVKAIICLVCFLIIFALSLWSIFYLIKKHQTLVDEAIVPILTGGISVAFIVFQISKLITCLMLPEKIIIEFLKNSI